MTDPDRYARDTTVDIDFDQRILETVDRYAAANGTDRRTAVHTLVLYGWSVEVDAQRKHPTWKWAFPDVDEDDPVAAREAVETKGRMVARWRADPALAEAAVAVYRLPHGVWAATVTTRTDPAGNEEWRVLLAADFEGAAWLGGQAIAPLTWELASRARGPIWTIAEGDQVAYTGWEGVLDADALGEIVTAPPSQRPAPADHARFEAMFDAVIQAGETARERGHRSLDRFVDDAQLEEYRRWLTVIEARGSVAATRIGPAILRWLEACHETGRTEAAAGTVPGYEFEDGRRVGAAEARAETARKEWVNPLLDLPAPRGQVTPA